MLEQRSIPWTEFQSSPSSSYFIGNDGSTNTKNNTETGHDGQHVLYTEHVFVVDRQDHQDSEDGTHDETNESSKRSESSMDIETNRFVLPYLAVSTRL